MSDIEALANKLADLVADNTSFADGARVLSQAGAPPALAAVLKAIDDTVLERTLLFRIGDVEVEMAVSGRRLRSIQSLSEDVPGVEDILGETISLEDTHLLKAVQGILGQICKTDPKVTVQHVIPTSAGTGPEVGVAATKLAEVWQIDMHATPPPPIDRFLSGNASAIWASIAVIEGGKPEKSGDHGAIEAVWNEQVKSFRTDHKSKVQKAPEPMLVCLEGALAGSGSVGLATMGDDMAVFAYDPEEITGLLSSWQAIVG